MHHAIQQNMRCTKGVRDRHTPWYAFAMIDLLVALDRTVSVTLSDLYLLGLGTHHNFWMVADLFHSDFLSAIIAMWYVWVRSCTRSRVEDRTTQNPRSFRSESFAWLQQRLWTHPTQPNKCPTGKLQLCPMLSLNGGLTARAALLPPGHCSPPMKWRSTFKH